MGEIRIGISGWTIHPGAGASTREDSHNTASSNTPRGGEFDRDQRLILFASAPESYRAWYEATPEGFVFSIKGNLSAKGAGWLVDAERQPPR